jgi:hypothetical protein
LHHLAESPVERPPLTKPVLQRIPPIPDSIAVAIGYTSRLHDPPWRNYVIRGWLGRRIPDLPDVQQVALWEDRSGDLAAGVPQGAFAKD